MTTPKPTEHKSVQARILKYAEDIGWTFVSQSEAEQRRGFDPSGVSPREKAKNSSRFFTDTLFDKVKEFFGKELCVDHCHKTGKIRGLLCFACNSGIGHLKDNKISEIIGVICGFLRK